MNVEILNQPDAACDTFVAQRSNGRICHLYKWSDAVTRGLSARPYYLIAREGNTVHGILPLTHVKSLLFGNFMVSQAVSDHGGPLVDSDQARDALFDRAVKLATEQRCESIEFRNTRPLPYDLQNRPGKMVLHLPLDPDPDIVWKSFHCKIRNQIRKAIKSNITATSGHLELLDDFYRVYAIRMKQLGTPLYSRKLLESLLRNFPDNSSLFIVRLNHITIGAALTFCFNGFAEIPFASTLVQYNKLCPNNLLYWSIIKHYCLARARVFDFGRCTIESPTYRFKKQWAPEPVDLHYQYWVRSGHQPNLLSPDNPKYKRRVEMWKKMPVCVTRLIGPVISRNLP